MKLGQTSIIHFGSKLFASVIGFVSMMYFSRTLGSDVIGAYFLIIAIVSWLKLGGTMGISKALTKRVSEGKEGNGSIIAVASILLFVFYTIIFLFLSLFDHRVNSYVGYPVTKFIYFLLLSDILFSFFTAILKGQEKVHIAGILSPVKTGLRSVLQLLLIVLGYELIGMLLGYFFGVLFGALLGLIFLQLNVSYPKKHYFNSLLSYAKYSWIGSVKSRVLTWLDILVLGLFVSNSRVGIYSICWTIAAFLLVFSSSMSEAIFPRISSIGEQKEGKKSVENLTNSAFSYAGLFSIPSIIGSFLIGNQLLLLYGEEYAQGKTILILLFFSIYLYGYMKQFLNILNALDRPDLAFKCNFLFMVSIVILNLILIYALGWVGAAIASVLSSTIGLFISHYFLSDLIDLSIPVLEITRQWFSAGLMGTIVYSLLQYTNSYQVEVLVAIISGSCSYILIYFIISKRFRRTISRNTIPIEIFS